MSNLFVNNFIYYIFYLSFFILKNSLLCPGYTGYCRFQWCSQIKNIIIITFVFPIFFFFSCTFSFSLHYTHYVIRDTNVSVNLMRQLYRKKNSTFLLSFSVLFPNYTLHAVRSTLFFTIYSILYIIYSILYLKFDKTSLQYYIIYN